MFRLEWYFRDILGSTFHKIKPRKRELILTVDRYVMNFNFLLLNFYIFIILLTFLFLAQSLFYFLN